MPWQLRQLAAAHSRSTAARVFAQDAVAKHWARLCAGTAGTWRGHWQRYALEGGSLVKDGAAYTAVCDVAVSSCEDGGPVVTQTNTYFALDGSLRAHRSHPPLTQHHFARMENSAAVVPHTHSGSFAWATLDFARAESHAAVELVGRAGRTRARCVLAYERQATRDCWALQRVTSILEERHEHPGMAARTDVDGDDEPAQPLPAARALQQVRLCDERGEWQRSLPAAVHCRPAHEAVADVDGPRSACLLEQDEGRRQLFAPPMLHWSADAGGPAQRFSFAWAAPETHVHVSARYLANGRLAAVSTSVPVRLPRIMNS